MQGSVENEDRPWGFPTRTARLSSADVRERVMSTARAELEATGLTVSLEHLGLEELIRASEVSRSSFYRIWPNKDVFYADLMVKLARPLMESGAAYDPETPQRARDVIEANKHLLGTREGRTKVLEEAVRVAAARNFEAIAESPSWRTYVALIATSASMPDGAQRDRLVEALRGAEEHFLDLMAGFYDQMMQILQVKLRPGVTTKLVAGLGASVVEGLAQRQITSPALVDARVMRPGLHEELVPWHPASLGFWGILQTLIEDD